MGAWVLASVFCTCALLTEAPKALGASTKFKMEYIPIRHVRQTGESKLTQRLPVEDDPHSAPPVLDNPEVSATNYQPYNVKVYTFSAEDARSPHPQNIYGYENRYKDGGSYEAGVNNEFSSIEAEAQTGGYNNENEFLDTTGYQHYQTATSFNLEGPKQLETITTNSFQREVEPYDVSSFPKSHKNEEEQAEVHYHQHKHLHKHNHKQEHTHKHVQDHKHEHGHKHDHHAKHEHKHDSQHKHSHHAEHKHNHKAEHQHKHQQKHEHSHHANHKHDHKHHQEHKHDHQHKHKHSHQGQHKHSHHNEHKHDHKHNHKHENQHKHKHEHQGYHKHKHEHKNEHKHKHHSSHKHKHSRYGH